MRTRSIAVRIPQDIFSEVKKISDDMHISFPAAMKVWEEKKFNLPKWKNL